MSVKSAEGVFGVLRALAATSAPQSASELAQRTGLPLTSASRAIATLEAAGYARRVSGAARFELGTATRLLAYAFMSQFPIRDAALPYLQQLVTVSGVSTSLFARLGRYAVRIAFIAGTNSVINMNALGETRLLTQGAPGLAMLAHSGADAAGGAVEHKLANIRRNGYAWEASTLDQGGHDLGIALLDRASMAQACVVLEGVAVALNGPLLEQIMDVLSELQQRIDGNEELFQSHYGHVDHDQIELTAIGGELRAG